MLRSLRYRLLIAPAAVLMGGWVASPAWAATGVPTLQAPSSFSRQGMNMLVRYDLPEAASAGSLTLTFTGAESDTLTLSSEAGAAGEHEFTLDTHELVGGPVVSSTHPKLADGTYTVVLAYQNLAHEPSAQTSASEVTVDSVTLAPSLEAPASGSVIGEPFTLQYKLPERAAAGTVVLTLAGATTATSTLTLADTAKGTQSLVVDPANLSLAGTAAGPAALANDTYTLTLRYQDSLGNPAATSAPVTIRVARTSSSGGAASSGTAPAGKPAPGASPRTLHVHWKLHARTRRRAATLTATFAVVAGAHRYTLVLVRGHARRTGACRVAGKGKHRQVTCAINAQPTGKWLATVTAVGAKGVLASASRQVSFAHRR